MFWKLFCCDKHMKVCLLTWTQVKDYDRLIQEHLAKTDTGERILLKHASKRTKEERFLANNMNVSVCLT